MRKTITVIFMLVVSIFLLQVLEAYSEEPVVKLRRSYKEVANQFFCETEAECNSLLFDVYTVQEIDIMRYNLQDQIDSLTKKGGIVDQKINSAEFRLTSRINHILDAKKDELLQITQAMQKQIDELKSQLENLKRKQ